MSITYKITYEHRDGKETRADEPTQDEVQDAVRRDSARFHSGRGGTEIAGFSIISVVSEP